jgi:hypothetical protein
VPAAVASRVRVRVRVNPKLRLERGHLGVLIVPLVPRDAAGDRVRAERHVDLLGHRAACRRLGVVGIEVVELREHTQRAPAVLVMLLGQLERLGQLGVLLGLAHEQQERLRLGDVALDHGGNILDAGAAVDEAGEVHKDKLDLVRAARLQSEALRRELGVTWTTKGDAWLG